MLTDVLIQENILEQIQDCFIKIDFNWNCLYANQKSIEFIGKPLNEVTGKSIFQLLVTNEVVILNQNLKKINLEKESVNFELYLINKKQNVSIRFYGGKTDINIYFTPNYIDNQFYKAFKHSPVALSITKIEDGSIIDINNQFEKLFKFNRLDVIGKKITNLNIIEVPLDRVKFLRMLRAKGNVKNYKTNAILKNGTIINIDLSLKIIELNSKPHILSTIIDISKKEILNKRIIKINNELESKVNPRTWELTKLLERERKINEMKTNFVSSASHEFRTPLATISTSLWILEKYLKPHQTNKTAIHFNRIQKSIDQLIKILNNFLSLDQLEQGKVKNSNSKFNLKKLSSEIIEDIACSLKKGQKINLLHFGECMVFTDKDILKNVITNLLSNAIKYSNENDEIELNIFIKHKNVVITIKDNGIGIPSQDEFLIFTRFFRAKNALNIQGSGLGLNIVKSYVELLKGTISFTSKINVGSQFTVKFKY
jgi:PAS domain S-box-containing protein